MNPNLQTPKRVLLRGFENDAKAVTTEWLKDTGVDVVNLVSIADLIVAAPGADTALLKRANPSGPKVVAWDTFRAGLHAARSLRLSPTGEPAEGADGLPEISASSEDPFTEISIQTPIEITETRVRILDLWLPRVTPDPRDLARVPSGEPFEHLCMDRPFLESLRAVALGVLYTMPVALEGDTASSKTSAVLYLAHLLGQPVVRINLSGHTDAAELVGRYVPAEASALLDWRTLTPETEWLRAESREMLSRARAESRGLCDTEKLALLGREQLPLNSWRFLEGYLPQAMRNGWWILLDEMNLAETQVLERLNSALENPPSLVLTEGTGTVFGKNGDVPVAANFRVFSTLNPSSYAGRATLSQALADRWGIWHQAAGPGELEIEQMLRTLVLGEQPKVKILGSHFQGEPRPAIYPELQKIADIAPLLQRLAVFHHGIFRAAGGGGTTPSIGRLNKERYSFSRRILLNLLRYVAERIKSGIPAEERILTGAIQVFYVARIRDEADRKAVNNILRAGGLV